MIHLKYTDKSITYNDSDFPVLAAMDSSQEDMLLSLVSKGCSKGYPRPLKSTPDKALAQLYVFARLL